MDTTSRIDLSVVPRDRLPVGVSTSFGSRMRHDATLNPVMLDMRMNKQNLQNEMRLQNGRIVSHQFALMHPSRRLKWTAPEGIPPGMDRTMMKKFQKRRMAQMLAEEAARAQEEAAMKKLQLSQAAAKKKAAAIPAWAEDNADPKEASRQKNAERKAEVLALADPGLDLEVARLVKDSRIDGIHQSLSNIAGGLKGRTTSMSLIVQDVGEKDPDEDDEERPAAFMPRNRLARALEAAGHPNPDPNFIIESLRHIQGDGPLDLHEFAIVVVAFNKKRTERLRGQFKELDGDNSGTISGREFRHLLWDLGYTVSTEVVAEFFGEADVDQSGQIDFREFESALELVHMRHGFTKAQVIEFNELFDRYDTDKSGEIAADELASALGWFGSPTSIDQARAIISKFDDDSTGDLCKCEFLQVMRARLEHEIENMRALFAEYDEDRGGTMDKQECLGLMHRLGYSLSPAVLDEGVRDLRMSGDLVFEDVLKLVQFVREREGFSEAEVKELKEVFEKHDTKNTGNLREFELARCLTWLGYPISPHKRRQLWCKVDVDKTNSIEENEFLKLVRLLREEETSMAAKLLEKSPEGGLLREKDLKDTLVRLAYVPSAEVLAEACKQSADADGDGKIDMQGIINILNFIRESQVVKLRQSAGLPDNKAAKIRGKFGYRAESGKHILPAEFERFMYELFPIARRSKDDRERIRKLIAEHCQDDGAIDFKEAFWIVRTYQDMRDEDAWMREQQIAADAGFSAAQVSQFRQAFVAADFDGSGYLSDSEILAVFDEVMALNMIQVQMVKSELGRLGDKKDALDFGDFMKLMQTILNDPR